MFGGRKQWKFAIVAGNNERIDPRDTYANVGDVFKALHQLLDEDMQVAVHYADGIEWVTLRG